MQIGNEAPFAASANNPQPSGLVVIRRQTFKSNPPIPPSSQHETRPVLSFPYSSCFRTSSVVASHDLVDPLSRVKAEHASVGQHGARTAEAA